MKWAQLLQLVPTVAALLVPSQQPASKTPSRRSRPACRSSTSALLHETDQVDETTSVPILPARQPLPSFFSVDDNDKDQFSLLSWNVLLPNSQDNWWCHKQYASWVDVEKRQWPHRHGLIRERLLESKADIVCIQEADGDTFEDDFAFMSDAGYDHVLHRKFRFRCATFFQRNRFAIEEIAHKDRTLVTSLRYTTQQNSSRMLSLVNCHLSGGAAPERRLRQIHEGLEQIRKWTDARERTVAKLRNANRASPKNIAIAEKALGDFQTGSVIVAGDFNSDGNTAVRKLLVDGSVEPDWHEPQYPSLRLTSKRKEHSFGSFVDAAELVYQGNVCDGDYSEVHSLSNGVRPATYVVPNLASLLLLPVSDEEGPPRTEFGLQVARGLADTLDLRDFCDTEIDRAFEQVDNDGNGLIDREEVQRLLESAYVATYGQQIEQERNDFFRGFGTNPGESSGLTKGQFTARLKALQQDREGERKAFGMAKGLDLQNLSETEMEHAFERMDLDGNGLLDEAEYQTLLESVYVAMYGEEIKRHRSDFFSGFENKASTTEPQELSKDLFTDRLLALHQELEGGRKGAELAEVRTEADAQKVVERFTPLLQHALDEVFDKFSSNGDTLTQEEVNEFLIRTNGELGRGGTFRHTSAIFSKKMEASMPPVLTRRDWYGVFARELSEGKWWQAVHDLEICGVNLRSHDSSRSKDELYQAWLDYIYFDCQGLHCAGVQDVLTETERSRIYNDGDALPNEWHPSDHLPIAAVFSWKQLSKSRK